MGVKLSNKEKIENPLNDIFRDQGTILTARKPLREAELIKPSVFLKFLNKVLFSGLYKMSYLVSILI